MKSSHAQRAGFSKVNVLAFWLKGHRTVWKVPHGWNRPGHWDKNKGASVVSVSIPHCEGLSRAICYMFSGRTEWDKSMCTERLITLPIIMHPSRWLLVCTWAIIYKKDPLQSCLLGPSYSQRHAALEISPHYLFLGSFYWLKQSLLNYISQTSGVKHCVFAGGCCFLCVLPWWCLSFQMSFAQHSEFILFEFVLMPDFFFLNGCILKMQ